MDIPGPLEGEWVEVISEPQCDEAGLWGRLTVQRHPSCVIVQLDVLQLVQPDSEPVILSHAVGEDAELDWKARRDIVNGLE